MHAIIPRVAFGMVLASMCLAQESAPKPEKRDSAPKRSTEQTAVPSQEQLSRLRDAAKIGDSKAQIPTSDHGPDVIGQRRPFDSSRIRDLPDPRKSLRQLIGVEPGSTP
jgi:hypothetical protein